MGKLREEDKGPGVLSSTENALASRLQSYFIERALTESPGAAVPVSGEILEVKFDNLDIVGWLPAGLKALFKVKPHPWMTPAPVAEPIGNQFRVALFSDWGTGLYGAPVIRASIERDAGFQLLMHLGDTYYSGTDREIKERLVDVFPTVKPGVIRRSLNGNHEMYSGGKGYFDAALPFLKQGASCFAYQNSRWLLVGLDTAYVDHNLDEQDKHGANKTNQVEWLKQIVNAGNGRRVILFSHHQPFSQLDSQGPKVVAAMGDELLTHIHAWFWGHEHRCVVYSTHAKFGFKGRCIGHGGFPAFRDTLPSPGTDAYQWQSLPQNEDAPAAEVLDGPNKFIKGEESRYSPHGYVTLEFNGDECVESYFAADAEKLRDPEKL
jgi:predicted phosphodiesterase